MLDMKPAELYGLTPPKLKSSSKTNSESEQAQFYNLVWICLD